MIIFQMNLVIFLYIVCFFVSYLQMSCKNPWYYFLYLKVHNNASFQHVFSHLLTILSSWFFIYSTHTHTHTHTHIYIHIHKYTLLVLGWTHFCLQSLLNSSWHRFNKVLKHSSEILVHIDIIASRSCCRFVGCTPMMQISHSTTSQRCSIGLRSGDCGGHLSKGNSLSCSRNQSEMIWALWHGALSCWN